MDNMTDITERIIGRQKSDYKHTDYGNAERLVRQHGKDLRYCYAWGRWLVWEGARWKVDDEGEVTRRAKDVVRTMYAQAAKTEDKDERMALVNHAKRSESKSRIADMIALAQSEKGIPVRPDELDSDPWLLNVQNGIVDLRTGEKREHRRDDLITKMSPVEWDPEATAPTFTNFLEQVLPNEPVRRFLQRVIGYCVTADVSEQKLFFLYGSGANGKSTLINAILEMLGDYGKQAAPELLTAKPHTHPTELADLLGARFVPSVEIEDGRRMAESLVKQLTGGDRIKARYMRQDFFEFSPTHKVLLAANHKPEVRGTDHAIWRRIKLIPFEVTIPEENQNHQLPAHLRDELPGILRWAVNGCLEWCRDGLGEPDEVTTATEQYRAEQDVLASFISDCCVTGKDVWSPATPLFKKYEQWCLEQNETAEKQRKFGERLRERGYESFDITSGAYKGRKGWRRIALRVDNPGPDGGDGGGNPPPDPGDKGRPGGERVDNHRPDESALSNTNPAGEEEDGRQSRPKSDINSWNLPHEALNPKKGLLHRLHRPEGSGEEPTPEEREAIEQLIDEGVKPNFAYEAVMNPKY